ncbi:MAG: protein translocase subunit SecD [Lachnospiraceae bacterium]|nr:protein translocase subunit SecD [Lachnospiraceae bacterium]
MNKKDNKGLRIAGFFLILALTGFMGYTAIIGWGPNRIGSAFNVKQGLDLAGGVSITYQIVGEEAPTQEDINDTIYKLKMKAESYSTEAQVYQEGADRITIEIPGVTDADAILKELGKPGSLFFIAQTDSNGNTNYTVKTTADGNTVYFDENGEEFYYTGENSAYYYDEETNGPKTDENGNPVSYPLDDAVDINVQYTLLKPIEELRADGSVILEGSDVKSAKAVTQEDKQSGIKQNVVSLAFNDAGKSAFAKATTKAVSSGETIAIYYDGNFISVPRVNDAITTGEAVITGMGSFEDADRLAAKIRIGALKLTLEEIRSNIVGAQLGSDAIRTSLLAGIIGFALVAVIMIAVYFLPGAAAVLALVLYTYLIIACLSVFNEYFTLTLPGIAGIILSIGMAVDANVIIFARIREELATGKTLQSSVDIGFKKALSAILDGNITTLIASVVLMIMGTGSVKGFAQTLALGIVLSMITALFVTRVLINGLISMGATNVKLFGVAKEKKTIDFLSKGKIFSIISALVIVAGIAVMIIFQVKDGKALAFSLEFMGGTSTTATLNENLSIEEIDSQITPSIEKITGDGNVQVTKVEGSNAIIVKTRTLNEDERNAVSEFFVNEKNVDPATITSETISATVSNEMRRDSIISVTVAVICMLIYIWIRFSDFRFGASSVMALVHDVLVVLAFYAIARVSVSSTFIACMLTIVGYSINATIVIFDRVRENRKEAADALRIAASRKRSKKNAKNEEETSETATLKNIVNRSITQTLSRSIFTSLTTFVMVLMLFILGVTSIREFALPLMIGIACGAYSSICLAGFFWFTLRTKIGSGKGMLEDEDEEDKNYV